MSTVQPAHPLEVRGTALAVYPVPRAVVVRQDDGHAARMAYYSLLGHVRTLVVAWYVTVGLREQAAAFVWAQKVCTLSVV